MIPLYDSEKPKRFPFWTVLIIILNIWVFYLQFTTPDPEGFIISYALIPSFINFSDPYSLAPFITSQFLHGGLLHIISNMWFLWIFGDNVEERFGILYPLLYLLFGGAGAFAQYIFTPNSTIPMLGASGAIAGVLGAYFALFPHHTIKTLVPILGFFTIINVPAFFMLFYWLLTQFFSGALTFSTGASDMGGVAYFAHIGGFVAGFVIAKLFFRKQPELLQVE